jgi:hypothetical protein
VHYIPEGQFTGHKIITDKTIGEMISDFAGIYQPIEGLKLSTAEIRKLNKAIDVLEAGPERGYFAIEDEDFGILQRVTVALIESSSLARAAPYVEDIFLKALTSKPRALDNITDIGEAAGG